MRQGWGCREGEDSFEGGVFARGGGGEMLNPEHRPGVPFGLLWVVAFRSSAVGGVAPTPAREPLAGGDRPLLFGCWLGCRGSGGELGWAAEELDQGQADQHQRAPDQVAEPLVGQAWCQ